METTGNEARRGACRGGAAADVDVVVCDDHARWVRAAADAIVADATVAVRARGTFSLALAGGNTPRDVYLALADPKGPYRAVFPWDRTHVFWGDERWVPSTHPDNNYRMACDAMLCRVPIPPAHVHRFPTDAGTCEDAAHAYRDALAMDVPLGPEGAPVLDACLLGLGADGHTASLFPHVAWSRDVGAWVACFHVPGLPTPRLSLLPEVINASRHVLVLAEGAAKADAVARALYPRGESLPIHAIRPSAGRMTWILDAAAAARCPFAQGNRT